MARRETGTRTGRRTRARDANPRATAADHEDAHDLQRLIRIFDRDLAFAGIARIEQLRGKEVVFKTDERGRTVDIHALRHTFGTHLCRAGVPLRTAQAAMRHSDPSLTAIVYTDPKLLDVPGALESLPRLDAGSLAAATLQGSACFSR